MASSSLEQYPQLISLAVHEFRTPASVVAGYLRMLQRDVDQPLTERQRRMIDEAEKSCARLVSLIAELSDIGKLDSGAIRLLKAPVDVFTLVREVADHVHEARDRDVQLVVLGDESAAPMNGDTARLRQAFDTVFRTILREKAGPSTVVAERRRAVLGGHNCAVIVVADEPGVQDAYNRPRVPFAETRGGLGLALPLARRVIEGHGGRLQSPSGDDPTSRGSAIIELPLTE
jgi:signal transduction histidine kinase